MCIEAFRSPGRFYRGNIHTHSTNSDGHMSPQETCEFYHKNHYDFVMLSDHFLGDYNYPVTDTRPFRKPNFTTLIGAEIHAPANSHGDLWHIVAAGLPLDFEPPNKDESAFELATRAFDTGAFIGLAHPAWSGLTVEEADTMDMAHAVEIYNYGCARETDRSDGFYLLDALSNKGKRLSGYAVDDAHFQYRDYLGAWVMVKAESLDPDHLLAAMKAGDYYSTQGPELISMTIFENEIHIHSSPAYSIAVLGRGCRSKYLCSKDESEEITKAVFPLEPFARDWFRVVIVDNDGKRAWSNPVWPVDQ